VYSAVATEVARQAAIDASKGNEHAQLVREFISRKVIKQTVMTSVYGVTIPGARAQILSRLMEVPALQAADEQALLRGALYLAQLTLHSLGNVFVSAQATQSWLGDVASLVTKARAGQGRAGLG
jgi:DNA-directed RNA polymerase